MASGHDTGGRPGASGAARFVPPPPDGALEFGGIQAVVHSVHLLALAIDTARNAAAQHLQLNAIDVTAMIEVYNYPHIRPSELGRTLNLGSAGSTALAERLVRAGYLHRQPDPSDRRASLLRLSPAGVHATGWVFQAVSSALAGSLGQSVTEHDLAPTLLKVAEALSTAFGPSPGQPPGPAPSQAPPG